MQPNLGCLIVKLRPSDNEPWSDRVARVVQECGGASGGGIPELGWARVNVGEEAISDLFLVYQSHPDVEDVTITSFAKPMSAGTYHAPVAAPLADTLYALKRMNVFRAWKYVKGAGVTVAAVDDGFPNMTANTSFPDDYGYDWSGKSVTRWYAPTDTDQPINDGYGGLYSVVEAVTNHGQAVLSCMAAPDNGRGMTGVAPDATALSMRCYYAGPDETMPRVDFFAMAQGITLSVSRFGARVVNLSQGTSEVISVTPAQWVASNSYFADALAYARDHGALVFVAAGNQCADSAKGTYQYPGASAPLYGHFRVTCLSYEQEDRPVAYTAVGPDCELATDGQMYWVPFKQTITYSYSIPAPSGWVSPWGDLVESSGHIIERYQPFNGTSCASPLAGGVAALVFSANPSLTNAQVHDILLETGNDGHHPEFTRLLPNSKIPDAARAVLRALSLANPGAVYPYVGFYGRGGVVYGRGVEIDVAAGVATTHLRGHVELEIDGFSTDAITNVELWAGTDLIYSGAPRRAKDGNLLPFAAARLEGKQLRVVVTASTATADETYTDVVGHATSNLPPRTIATPVNGQTSGPITLTASGANPPFTIEYRWDGGAWTPYTGPITPRTGTLEYRATDVFGSREGG